MHGHPTRPRVVVIGAGFGGLGVGIELLRAGFTDLTILERADDVGGVWRDNTYPGAACDVPSPLYSWSFAPNPGWGRRYSAQAEIHAYIRRVAEQTGVRRHVRTGVTVTSARWSDATATWTVGTAEGEELEADILVPAVGQLSEPVVPELPGRDLFVGPAFHSARWRHDVDLAGKRVAVVGTGASAIQFVPRIATQVSSMVVFQRSAPYVVPKPDRAYTRLHRAAYERFPRTQEAGRRATFTSTERLNAAMVGDSRLRRGLVRLWRATLRQQVRDPRLRAKLVPDHPLGCKRLLFSNEWYPALSQPHVDVVTEAVTAVEAAGVRTADGRLHEADVIIWGTGFAAADFLATIDVTGTDGRNLQEVWQDGARAHLGICVPGFPNLFLMYGPNTNLGGSSIIGMLEAQASYVVSAARALASGRAPALAVRRDVAEAYDAEMQSRLADSVWAGCDSWYRAEGGRITTNWPGLVAEYQERAGRFDLDDFTTSPGPGGAPTPAHAAG